jgi:hypothetical protein
MNQPAGYPASFPFLTSGVIDSGYAPELGPGEVSSVLIRYPDASPVSFAAELRAKAEKAGWTCTSDGVRAPIKLSCRKGSDSTTISVKDHPLGGTALFVNVP